MLGSEGRSRFRTRRMASISIMAARMSAGSMVWTMILSTTPRGFTTFWMGEWAGAMARLSMEIPKRDPCSSRTPTTR